VSYGLAIAGDARADFRNLDVWLQEEVWDELEKLAADPSLLKPSLLGNSHTHALNRTSGGTTHRLVMSIVRNDGVKLLTVIGISAEEISPPLP
jgi:hypothetical protein